MQSRSRAGAHNPTGWVHRGCVVRRRTYVEAARGNRPYHLKLPSLARKQVAQGKGFQVRGEPAVELGLQVGSEIEWPKILN